MDRLEIKYSLLKNDSLQEIYNENDEDFGFSSGYDSNESSESDFSNSDADVTNDEDHEFWDGDYFHQIQTTSSSEALRYNSTDRLCDQLQYILSMPELCDVTFYVGPQKETVHGVKAILGTRSRFMYQLILKNQREAEEERKTSKKLRTAQGSSKTKIDVNKYQPEDFKEIIKFMHCGMADIKAKNVVGILCGASQFGLEDLKSACWSFVRKCVTSRSTCVQTITQCAKKYKEHRVTERLVRKINEEIERN